MTYLNFFDNNAEKYSDSVTKTLNPFQLGIQHLMDILVHKVILAYDFF